MDIRNLINKRMVGSIVISIYILFHILDNISSNTEEYMCDIRNNEISSHYIVLCV